MTKDNSGNVALWDVLHVCFVFSFLSLSPFSMLGESCFSFPLTCSISFFFFSQGVLVEELGSVDIDEVSKDERFKSLFVPNWFSCDIKTGVSTCTLSHTLIISLSLSLSLPILF